MKWQYLIIYEQTDQKEDNFAVYLIEYKGTKANLNLKNHEHNDDNNNEAHSINMI